MPTDKLKELGIPVPVPKWKKEHEPHELDGAEISWYPANHLHKEGQSYSFETVTSESGRTDVDKGMAGHVDGAPALKTYRGVKLLRLENGHVVLVQTKSDNYSAYTRVKQVLIDIEDPSEEELEAMIHYGKYHSTLI